MAIQPYLESVGTLFGKNNIFRVPRYQRYYAWDGDQVTDFLNDLELCHKARREGGPSARREHFFGGLVTVRVQVEGTSRLNMEVIDGQQRLASFLMLVSQLRAVAMELANVLPPSDTQTFLLDFAANLKAKYQVFNDKVHLKLQQIDRLELSRPDLVFFKQLIAGTHPTSTRISHDRLLQAWDRIGVWLGELVLLRDSDEEKASMLNLVDEILESDWILIHMITDSKAEAYRLFRVLNDRGTGLTEGELIRAQLLEALDGKATAQQLQRVEDVWDDILGSQPESVEQLLRTTYASRTGKRAGTTSLLDDFIRDIFPELAKQTLAASDVGSVVAAVEDVASDLKVLTKLQGGEWPYESSSAVSAWDRSRLGLLVNELKHTNCLPLLLSAVKLQEAAFAEVVQTVERFMFRYKVICDAHIGPATKVYHEQAVKIRQAPQTYKAAEVRKALQELLSARATDEDFVLRLKGLKYSRDQSNKPLKYFLITIESYLKWHQSGKAGLPVCSDKMTVFDPSATTIEHIYAENSATPDAALAAVLDTLGNLTLLGVGDNDAAGNKPFTAKKPVFEHSSLLLNRLIAKNSSWGFAELQARQHLFEQAAKRIFRVF
jgi:hypothetical protein